MRLESVEEGGDVRRRGETEARRVGIGVGDSFVSSSPHESHVSDDLFRDGECGVQTGEALFEGLGKFVLSKGMAGEFGEVRRATSTSTVSSEDWWSGGVFVEIPRPQRGLAVQLLDERGGESFVICREDVRLICGGLMVVKPRPRVQTRGGCVELDTLTRSRSLGEELLLSISWF